MTHADTVAQISALVASRSLAQWVTLLEDVDACVTPVLTLDEALNDPHAAARGMTLDVPSEGPIQTQFAFPLKMTDFDFTVDRLPPGVGEHTVETLASLGYSSDEIAKFSDEGLV